VNLSRQHLPVSQDDFGSRHRKADWAGIALAPGPGGKQEKVVMAVYSEKYNKKMG
jgi:hypothetical protein